MKHFGKRIPAALALAGLIFLGAPRGAHATLMLEVNVPDFNFNPTPGGPVIHDILFVDNNTGVTPGTVMVGPDGDTDLDFIGNDFNPTAGILQLGATPGGSITVGSFLVSGSIHTSNSPGVPLPGGTGLAQINSSAFSVTNTDTVAHTQNIVVGDTGFTTPVGNILFTSQAFGQFAGSGGTIRNRTFDDPLNRQFGGSDEKPGGAFIGMDLTRSANYSDTTAINVNLVAPYSKTIEFVLTLNAGGSLIQRSNAISNLSQAVPEPGTLAAIATGLPLVGLLAWNRRRKARA